MLRADRSNVRCACGLAILLAALATSGAAFADVKDDAASAYDRGAAAYDKKDYVTAAKELARADELAPNGITLELALDAVVRTDDAVLGLTLADRAGSRKATRALEKNAEAARRKFGPKAGKLKVICRDPCEAVRVDGKSFAQNDPRWIGVGQHELAIDINSSTQASNVTIEPGKTVEVIAPAAVAARPTRTDPPPPPSTPAPAATTPSEKKPPPKPESSDGLSPTWFWVGAGITVAAGAATVLSGLDTSSKYDTFSKDRSNADAANAGRSADQRTVILIAGTSVVAAATAVIGLFFVDWKDHSAPPSAAWQPGFRF